MRTNIILILIIVITLGLCYFFGNKWQQEKNERIRINNNLISEVNAKNDVYTQLNIKVKELALIKPKYDSIVKANKILPKEVQKIITYETRIKWDTIPFILHPPIADSSNRIITVAGIDNCFTSEGLIDLRSTKLYPSNEDVDNIMFSLFNTKVIDKGGVIYYSKRDTTRWWILKYFYPKKFYSKSFSDCGSKVEIQEINIVKK